MSIIGRGEMAERLKAPDSKSGVRLVRTVGSNPTLSAATYEGGPPSMTGGTMKKTSRVSSTVMESPTTSM